MASNIKEGVKLFNSPLFQVGGVIAILTGTGIVIRYVIWPKIKFPGQGIKQAGENLTKQVQGAVNQAITDPAGTGQKLGKTIGGGLKGTIDGLVEGSGLKAMVEKAERNRKKRVQARKTRIAKRKAESKARQKERKDKWDATVNKWKSDSEARRAKNRSAIAEFNKKIKLKPIQIKPIKFKPLNFKPIKTKPRKRTNRRRR